MLNNFHVSKKVEFANFLRSLIFLILPGCLVVVQLSGILGMVGLFVLPIFLLVVAIPYLVDVKKTGQMEVRHFPILGVLFWEVQFLATWLLGAHGAESVFEFLFGVFAALSLVVVFRRWKYIPKSAWIIIFLFVLILWIIAAATLTQWLKVFPALLLTWLIRVMPFFAAGLLLLQRAGSKATLLMISCIPLWLEMYLPPYTISYENWNSPDPQIQLALSAIVLLPPLCFFILIPIVASIIVDVHKFKVWLAGSSLVCTSSLVIVWVSFLLNPEADYIFSIAQTFVYFVLILWTPIVISILVFDVSDEA
jgi:hypothetical protein